MNRPISFAKDISPLFSPVDIKHMALAFDLGNYEHVKKHAQPILQRLKGQGGAVMPPPPANGGSGPWAEDKIALFESWIDGGLQP